MTAKNYFIISAVTNTPYNQCLQHWGSFQYSVQITEDKALNRLHN